MNLLFFVGIFFAILGALTMNVGKGVQKMYVQVFLTGRRMFKKENRRLLYGWLIGLGMTATTTVWFSIALKFTASPSYVASMTGFGLIGLTFFAVKVIGETITPTDAFGMALVIVGTSVLGYLGAGVEVELREVSTTELWKLVGPVLGLTGMACVGAWTTRRFHGLTFGLAAGICIGTALLFGDVALILADGSLTGQLRNPYSYLGITIGTGATIFTQLGFIRSRALVVVPAANSSAIISPILLELSLYGTRPATVTLALIAVILTGVMILSTGAAARAQDAVEHMGDKAPETAPEADPAAR